MIEISCRCYSWKFPDQLATDVQIKDLLERYQFSKNELDNQVAHVILFEILIDRFVFLSFSSIDPPFIPLDYYSFYMDHGDISMGFKRNSFLNSSILHRLSTKRRASVLD